MPLESNNNRDWKAKLHEIIYEADTPTGKLFDILLLIAIIASIILVMLESVGSIDTKYHTFLYVSEWVITILFSIEYITRVITVKKPSHYIFSFYGIIDFLSTIPMYLSFFLVGSQSLVALRALRLLRVFRILKLTRYIGESTNLVRALKLSRARIAVFISFVVILCVILGTGKWIYKYTKKRVLGYCYSYYSWLWRYCSSYAFRTIYSFSNNDIRLWYNNNSYWHNYI